MALVIVGHPDDSFSGYARPAGRGFFFSQGFTEPVDLTTAQQNQLTATGYTVNGQPETPVPDPFPQYLTEAKAADAAGGSGPLGVELRAAFVAVVTPQQYGAAGDGVRADAAAVQSAIDAVRDTVRAGGLTADNVVTIPGGIYNLGATGIVAPPYVKLHLLGTVMFRYTGAGTALRITPLDDDPVPLDALALKHSYLNSPIFQGGGLILAGPGVPSGDLSDAAGIGLEVGARDTTPGATRPMSRYSNQNVAILGFDIGLQLNTRNHFLGQYRNVHLEINRTNLRFGDGTTIDAGENFHFDHCVLAGASIGVLVASSGLDLTFTACSFDYMDRAISIEGAGYGNINIHGGHIEAITPETDAPLYGALSGGVVVAAAGVENQNVNFQDVTILTSAKDPLIRGPVVASGTVALRPAGDTQTASGLFAAARDVDATQLRNRFMATHKAVSHDHNLIPDPQFKRPTVGAVAAPAADAIVGWDLIWEGSTVTASIVADGFDGGKAFRVVIDPGFYVLMEAADPIPVRNLADVYAGVVIKASAVGANVTATALFQRPDGTTHEGPTIGLGTTALPGGSWQTPQSLLSVNYGASRIDVGSVATVRPRFAVSNPTGAPITVDVGLLFFGS